MPMIAIFSRTATWRMTTSKNGRAGEDIFRSLQEKWEERRAGGYDLFGKAVGCARINQKLEALHLLPRNSAYLDLDVALALSGRAWRWPHPHGFSILNTQFSLLSPQALKGAGRNTTFVISSPPVRQDASEGSALSAAPGKHTHTLLQCCFERPVSQSWVGGVFAPGRLMRSPLSSDIEACSSRGVSRAHPCAPRESCTYWWLVNKAHCDSVSLRRLQDCTCLWISVSEDALC